MRTCSISPPLHNRPVQASYFYLIKPQWNIDRVWVCHSQTFKLKDVKKCCPSQWHELPPVLLSLDQNTRHFFLIVKHLTLINHYLLTSHNLSFPSVKILLSYTKLSLEISHRCTDQTQSGKLLQRRMPCALFNRVCCNSKTELWFSFWRCHHLCTPIQICVSYARC